MNESPNGAQAPIPPADPREVRVQPVDQILAACHDPRKPSAGAIAEALLSLQRQVLLVNNNQRILQNQHAKIAAAIDRATDALFDKTDGAGGVTHGVASAVHALYEKIAGMENATSNYVLFSATCVEFLRSGLPQLLAKHGRFPTETECEEAINSIMADMKRKGDEAQLNRARLEKSIERMVNCSFCTNWCASRLIVAGQEPKSECNQEFVQLACPRCMQVSPQPVKPMDVGDAKCGACGGPLEREVTDEGGTKRTMCQLFSFSPAAAREELVKQDFPQEEILAAFPLEVSPIERNIGGEHDPSIGVAEVPPGETRPLTP